LTGRYVERAINIDSYRAGMARYFERLIEHNTVVALRELPRISQWLGEREPRPEWARAIARRVSKILPASLDELGPTCVKVLEPDDWKDALQAKKDHARIVSVLLQIPSAVAHPEARRFIFEHGDKEQIVKLLEAGPADARGKPVGGARGSAQGEKRLRRDLRPMAGTRSRPGDGRPGSSFEIQERPDSPEGDSPRRRPQEACPGARRATGRTGETAGARCSARVTAAVVAPARPPHQWQQSSLRRPIARAPGIGYSNGMETTPPSFKELLRKGQLASAARIADLDESETIQLARRLAEMIPHWSEVSRLPAVVEGAIAAGVKAGHFKPGDLSTELLTGKLLGHIPPASVELRMNGRLRMQRSWRAR